MVLLKIYRIFFSIFQAMPILTTTYPLMNSTFNVSQHTQKLIQEKMVVASKICDRVLNGEEPWESLFKVILSLNTFAVMHKLASLVQW